MLYIVAVCDADVISPKSAHVGNMMLDVLADYLGVVDSTVPDSDINLAKESSKTMKNVIQGQCAYSGSSGSLLLRPS